MSHQKQAEELTPDRATPNQSAFQPSFPNPEVWTDELVRQRQAEFETFQKTPQGIAEERAFDDAWFESEENRENARRWASTLERDGVVTAGIHVGPIVEVQESRIAQKIGRDPDKVVWHELTNLKGLPPKLGEMAEIGYSDGVGTVIAMGRSQEIDRAGRGVDR